MSDKISGTFHPIPCIIANQWWTSIRNIIIYLETKFRPNRRIFVFLAIGNQRWISIRNIIIYLKTKFCPNQRIFVFGGHANGRHFEFFKPPKAATHYCGYSYKVSWSLMKGIQTNYKSPLFYFHGNCGKVCPTDSDFFGLSCSTRCGCCSYQVSSISVRRVTYYDHFCVFQFFSILAVYMAMTAILKIPKVVCTSTHSA